MRRLEPEIIDYYNNEVVMLIAEKYGLSQMEALKAFVCSKTHEMLENEECEKVTGDPRNSVYIREE